MASKVKSVVEELVGGSDHTESIIFTKAVIDDYIVIEGEIEAMAVLNDVQQIQLAVEGRNKRGNPSQVYGIPEWSTTTAAIFQLEPAADGLSCLAKCTGVLGDGVITCRAKVKQATEDYREKTITIPVAASETDSLVIVEGAITVQDEFA